MKDKRILILFLTIFIDLLGFGVVIPILPNLAKSLASGSTLPFNPDVAVGVVVGSFSIIQFLFAPIFGSLSDRIGRRPILLVSILFNIVGYILFGLSSSFVFLLLARIVSGFGSANIAAAQAYIADITPPEDRAKRMGIIGAAFGLGFVFGPPIGGWLYHAGGEHGLRWVGLCCLRVWSRNRRINARFPIHSRAWLQFGDWM
jgi:multidrug resistance protein